MSFSGAEYDAFYDYCEKNLDLSKRPVRIVEYLPICIMDAIFSIGAKYQSCINLEERYIAHYGYKFTRTNKNGSKEHTIDEFIDNINACGGSKKFAENIIKNTQRTSSKNGILKSKACYEFAMLLKNKKINTVKDFEKFTSNPVQREELDKEIRAIRGQSSGVMLHYFYKNVVHANQVKDDRHIINFTNDALSTKDVRYTFPQLNDLFGNAVKRMSSSYPDMNINVLDYIVWDYMSSRSASKAAKT